MLTESLNWTALLGLLESEVDYCWDFVLGLGMEENGTKADLVEGFGSSSSSSMWLYWITSVRFWDWIDSCGWPWCGMREMRWFLILETTNRTKTKIRKEKGNKEIKVKEEKDEETSFPFLINYLGLSILIILFFLLWMHFQMGVCYTLLDLCKNGFK